MWYLYKLRHNDTNTLQYTIIQSNIAMCQVLTHDL